MMSYILTHSPIFYLIQSLWRDEVFSILVAQKPIWFYFTNMSFEPPLYYILLHLWVRIFGIGEISARMLSFTAFVLATIIIIEWSSKLFKKSPLAWIFPMLFFLNPMLIYYSFEVRTYGWYIFFTVLSIYSYIEKKPLLLTISNLGGFYTHSFFIFHLFAQVIHFIFTNRDSLKIKNIVYHLKKNKIFFSYLVTALGIAPWLFKILKEASKLKQSWYFPVDINLIKSVLGNLFVGYEGTPWFLWKYTFYLSIFLLTIFIWALGNKKMKNLSGYIMMSIFIPLITVISISFIKPLYVNRYLISVTVSEIFLLAIGIDRIRNKYLKYLGSFAILAGVIIFNYWYPKQHPKTNFRQTLNEINKIKQPDDYFYASSSLSFFETYYYADNKNRVFFYTDNKANFPWYVGDMVFSNSQIISALPIYPEKAFIVDENANYYAAFKTQ